MIYQTLQPAFAFQPSRQHALTFSAMTAPSPQPTAKRGCANCIMRGLGVCRVLIELGWEQPRSGEAAEISQSRVSFAARRTIFHQDESLDSVPVICEGWATSMQKLSNGGRQILSFLLPGELIASGLVFEQQLRLSIDAITRGCYRHFDRSQLRAAMLVSPTMLDKILSAYNGERRRADQLITDLGRRTATERIARLLIDLWDRLEKLNKIEDNRVEFPLRQTHIADATGLTPVYVSNILTEFRKNGLVKVSDRSLQIVDMTKLRRLAM